MILWGVPSIKNNPILTFDFHPSRDLPGPRGTRGGLGVRRIKKLHKTENDQRSILAGVPFIKNVEIPKFLSAPRPAPPSSPAFRPRFLRPWAKNQNSAPNVLFASLSKFRKGVTQPPCPKTPGGDRFGGNPLFRGPGLTPRASGSGSPAQKLVARS